MPTGSASFPADRLNRHPRFEFWAVLLSRRRHRLSCVHDSAESLAYCLAQILGTTIATGYFLRWSSSANSKSGLHFLLHNGRSASPISPAVANRSSWLGASERSTPRR